MTHSIREGGTPSRRSFSVLDSRAELAYGAPQTERLPAYTWSTAGIASSRGASTLITSETALLGATELTLGLFVPVPEHDPDALLRSRVADIARMTVLKMRDSDHAKTHTGFAITDAAWCCAMYPRA